jgi:hypothetical protein
MEHSIFIDIFTSPWSAYITAFLTFIGLCLIGIYHLEWKFREEYYPRLLIWGTPMLYISLIGYVGFALSSLHVASPLAYGFSIGGIMVLMKLHMGYILSKHTGSSNSRKK